MKIKLLLLMLVIGLVGLSAIAYSAETLVYNASFEIDEDPADDWPDRWEVWGSDVSWWGDSIEEFIMDDPEGAHTGNNYFRGYCGPDGNYACAIPQTEEGGRYLIPFTEGDVYFIGVWAKDLMPEGIPSSLPPCIEVAYYDAGGNRDDAERHWIHVDIPADGQWHYIEGTTNKGINPIYPFMNAVPGTWTTYNRETEPFYDYGEGGPFGPADYAYDDLWVNTNPQAGLVYDFDPYDGEKSVPPSTTILSWKRRDKCPDRPLKVEVWWGTQDDPDFWGTQEDPNAPVEGAPKKILELADANSVDLSTIPVELGGPITLVQDSVYYWKVMHEEPNSCVWGVPELNEGPTLSFDTINRPPVVDAGLHLDKWMPQTGSLEIQLDASYTDDGLPEDGAVTYSWAPVSGITYDPNSMVEDPQILIDAPGEYTLTLTVNDSDKEGSDSILIRVFANDDDRMRAHYKLDESEGGIAADSVGGHHGTLEDDPVWQPAGGQVIGAIELDGIDNDANNFGDHISIDDTGILDPNDIAHSWENTALIDGMTVSAWMKLDADGWNKDWETIVGKSTDSWELLRDGDSDNIAFGIKGNVGSAVAGSTVNIPVTDNSWHHVVGVFDRNKVLLYIDGLEAGSDDAGALQIPMSAGKILIGNTNNPSVDPVYDFSFGGLIDEVKIFDAAVPWWADHDGTPGVVQMYRGDDGGINCAGEYAPGDQNQDCYVTLVDFAMMAADWMLCNDVANPDCN